MRILVLSRTPWRSDNSFGNTYNNFFAPLQDVQIASVYLADGTPKPEPFVTAYYQLSEKAIANQVIRFGRGPKVGRRVDRDALLQEAAAPAPQRKKNWFDGVFGYAKTTQLSGFFLMRELIWKLGKVNDEDLFAFIEDFKPDVIFMAVYYASYVSNLAMKIKKRFDIPLIVESAIDVYTMKQLSFDPFFWINRLMVRRTVRKMYKLADARFLISDKQRDEYSQIFGLDFKTLYKTPMLERCLYPYEKTDRPVKFLFTGNLSSGRWKVVAQVAKALSVSGGGRLDIYSATPISRKMRKLLSIDGVSQLHPPVSGDEVLRLQNEADVLIHVESFDLKNKLSVRYAISTKIMDYISDCRCILAIGPHDVASMELLKSEEAAVVVNDQKDIQQWVNKLVSSEGAIAAYAEKTKQACMRLAQKPGAGELLLSEMERVLAEYNKDSGKAEVES